MRVTGGSANTFDTMQQSAIVSTARLRSSHVLSRPITLGTTVGTIRSRYALIFVQISIPGANRRVVYGDMPYPRKSDSDHLTKATE